MLSVRFYGVRGSSPVARADVLRYGGNTSCVSIREVHGDALGAPLILDLGSGAVTLSEDLRSEGIKSASAILSHLHWDHLQGLPFFSLIDEQDSVLDLYVPAAYGPVDAQIHAIVSPPVFPVPLKDRPGEVRVLPLPQSMVLTEPNVVVHTLAIAHSDPTVAIRIESPRSAIAYVTDHQEPIGTSGEDSDLVNFCQGVDLLIHDAQYTEAEFAHKSTWGHSTYGYAASLAERCGAGRLAFFHHDPSRSDDQLDEIVDEMNRRFPGVGLLGAWEGMDILLS